jgi:extradiol dioxygenase family protein
VSLFCRHIERPTRFYVDVTEDIHHRKQELEAAGVAFSSAPHLIHREGSTGQETWMAFFDDPHGNTLVLSSRVRP